MENNKESVQEKKFDILPPKMIKVIEKLFDKVSPNQVDVDFLDNFKLISNKGVLLSETFTVNDLTKICGKFLYAKDICINNARVCEAFQLEADRRLSNEESLAQLERAIGKYGVLNEKTGKTEITDGKCKAYIETDEAVKRLRLLKNSWMMLNKYYNDQLYLFDKRYDWAKTQLEHEYKADPLANRVQ